MRLNRLLAMCAGLVVALALAGNAHAQLDQLPAGLTPQQILDLLNQLGVSGTGSAATQPTTTQPTTNRIGSPSVMINGAIAEHQAFNNRAFNTTTVTPPPKPLPQIRLPITFLFAGLLNLLDNFIPELAGLTAWFNNLVPDVPTPDPNDVEPPAGVTDRGAVAILTADDTSLRVGETTTVRLWVQQSSPNEDASNGIFSVGINVVADPAGVIEARVPATIISPWDGSIGLQRGTVTSSGGINGLAAGLAPTTSDRAQGTDEPVQVLHFTVEATGVGTVTLTPTNYTEGGFEGLVDWDSEQGDEDNYVPVEITVTR